MGNLHLHLDLAVLEATKKGKQEYRLRKNLIEEKGLEELTKIINNNYSEDCSKELEHFRSLSFKEFIEDLVSLTEKVGLNTDILTEGFMEDPKVISDETGTAILNYFTDIEIAKKVKASNIRALEIVTELDIEEYCKIISESYRSILSLILEIDEEE